jgi:ubiquinone/menaquinone biosynthesis C-methylase UbiE
MPQSDVYLLGRADAELARLRNQIADLALDSAAQLDRIGIAPGERVVDLGCGPGGVLGLLAERVGPTGHVLGIERSPHFVELARDLAAERGLEQVEVVEGDAYATGLADGSFDGASMRLVLVNVPEPERIVREMVRLVRPGGWIASFEADYVTHDCVPPLPAWRRLFDAYDAHARHHGIDLFVGRRIGALFAAAGVKEIAVDAVVHVYPPGHHRRPIFLNFIENTRDGLLEGGFVAPEALERDLEDLRRHLDDPGVQVTSHVFYRLTGRVP